MTNVTCSSKLHDNSKSKSKSNIEKLIKYITLAKMKCILVLTVAGTLINSSTLCIYFISARDGMLSNNISKTSCVQELLTPSLFKHPKIELP